MADVTISQLTPGVPSVNGIIPFSQGGQTYSTALAQLSALPFVPKAWANFNGKATIGTNQPIRSSYNIASILRTDDNVYEVTFPTGVFANANYTFLGTSSTTINRASIVSGPILTAPSSTKFKFCNISCVYTGQPAGWINESAEYIYIAFFAF